MVMRVLVFVSEDREYGFHQVEVIDPSQKHQQFKDVCRVMSGFACSIAVHMYPQELHTHTQTKTSHQIITLTMQLPLTKTLYFPVSPKSPEKQFQPSVQLDAAPFSCHNPVISHSCC